MGMLEQGAELEGVVQYCQDGLNWADMQENNSVDSILIRQAIHHIPQDTLPNLFSNLLSCLKPGGRVCMTKRGDLSWIFPWPEGFYQKVSASELTLSELRELLEKAGFINFETYSYQTQTMTSKTSVYSSYRHRFLSWFSLLTDKDIKEGISSLDSTYPGEFLPVLKQEDFLVARKPV